MQLAPNFYFLVIDKFVSYSDGCCAQVGSITFWDGLYCWSQNSMYTVHYYIKLSCTSWKFFPKCSDGMAVMGKEKILVD